jgi:hypothetical protein
MQDMKEMIKKMYKENKKLYKLVSDGQEAATCNVPTWISLQGLDYPKQM